MRYFTFCALFLFFSPEIFGQYTSGDFRTRTGVGTANWNATNIWETYNGSTFTTTTSSPPTNNASTVKVWIQSGANITMTSASTNLLKVDIASGATLNIASAAIVAPAGSSTVNKINVAGTLNINSGASLTLANTTATSASEVVVTGTGTVNVNGTLTFGTTSSATVPEMLVSGTLVNTGTIAMSGSNTLQLRVDGILRNSGNVNNTTSSRVSFSSGSTYNHAFTTNRGNIPFATWNQNSTVLISGYTTPAGGPTASSQAQTFGNFVWNTPNLSTQGSVDLGFLKNIAGNFTVTSTGTGSLYFDNSSTDFTTSSVLGNLSIASGTQVKFWEVGNSSRVNIAVAGNVTYASGSILENDKATVNLTLNGSANQNVDVQGTTFNDFTINNANHTINLNSAFNYTGVLKISSTNTSLNSNGNLTLRSTSDQADTGNASISTLPSGSAITGTVHVERYLGNDGRVYKYISAPVANFPVSSLQNDFPITGNFTGATTGCTGCTTNTSMWYYDGGTSAYVAFPKAPQTNATTLDVGRGYVPFIRQDILPGVVTIHWAGTVNQGNIDLPVAYNAANLAASWNLVGNPYPSSVDWDKWQQGSGNGWTLTNVSPSIAIRDAASGAFVYYDQAALKSFKIATGQAFWVRATDVSPALRIDENAKIDSIGAFYREGDQPVFDKLVISMASGTFVDKATYRVSADASNGLDNIDAPKLYNFRDDNVALMSLATLSPQGNSAMAINVVKTFACGDSITLQMSSKAGRTGALTQVAAGTYNISVSALGALARYQWLLRDRYTKKLINLSQLSSYSFTVDAKVAASKDYYRFVLIAKENPAAVNAAVSGKTQWCIGESGALELSNSQSWVDYTLEINGKPSSLTQRGTGSKLSFTLSDQDLSEGTNVIKVSANSGCSVQYLTNQLTVSKAGSYIPQTQSAAHCKEGSVTLQAVNVPAGSSVRWYASPDAQEALSTNASFSTPVIPKSVTYYISGINAFGCEGTRSPVVAEIIQYDDVTIKQIDDQILLSSYATGNQWYFNDVAIEGATGEILKADKTGTYSVAVQNSGCTTTARYAFTQIVTGTESLVEQTVSAYPNPLQGELLQVKAGSDVDYVEIYNAVGLALGRVVLERNANDQKTATIDFRNFPGGIYFVNFKGLKTRTNVKIVKN